MAERISRRDSFFVYLDGFLYFSMFVCCLSCTTAERKTSENLLLHYTVPDLSEEYVGSGGAIIACGDGIVGIEEAGALPPFFRLSEKAGTATCRHFGTRGQGPEEFVHPYPIQSLGENTFGVYDMMLKTYTEVSAPGNGTSIQAVRRVSMDAQLFSALKTADGRYIGLSMNEGMFALMDSTGRKTASFFEYPFRDGDEHAIKNQLRAMAYQGTFALNPQGTTCVYASLTGEIIHFYHIREDEITLISKTEKTYPLYKPDDQGTSYGSMTDWSNTRGYISLAATDRYVYALYCGKTLRDLQEETGSTMPAVTELRIFDWTGKMLKTCTLDAPSRYICATNDDSRLWAVALLPEATPVYFNLKTPAGDASEEAAPGKASFSPTEKEPAKGLVPVMQQKDDPPRANQLNLGQIKCGETKNFSMPMQIRITSLRASTKDIVLQDTLNSGKSVISIRLTKQQPGTFSDTVYLSSGDMKLPLVISGEAVK
jgi:hypothetical protein